MSDFRNLPIRRAFWITAIVTVTVTIGTAVVADERRESAEAERRDAGLPETAGAAAAEGADTGAKTTRKCEARPIGFEPAAGRKIVRIDIHETIDLGLAPFVIRTLEEAEKEGASLVLIHMDTPGGRVDAAQQIKDALLKSSIPTATLIDTHALSAGALIAYATDFIIVQEGSTIGAATPINIGQGGEAQPVGEKFVSAMRAIFRATAKAKGRDPDIAEAMVDAEVVVEGLVDDEKLLTLSGGEALQWCVADLEASSVEEALAVLNLKGSEVVVKELNWAERIARILTDPVVSGMLMTFGFLGILMELYTAGFGISGIIGVTCLLLFFLGHLVVNLVGLEEIILFIVGLGLLGFEVFVTPGFGLAGGLGVTMLTVSVILAMVGGDVAFSWDTGLLTSAIWRMAITFVATVGLFVVLARYLPNTGVFGRLVLQTAVENTSFEPVPEDDPVAPGAVGVALSAIPGSGKARIADRTIDVVTQGEFIERGEAVVVLEARTGRVVVGPREA